MKVVQGFNQVQYLLIKSVDTWHVILESKYDFLKNDVVSLENNKTVNNTSESTWL